MSCALLVAVIRDAAGMWWDACTRAAGALRPLGYRLAEVIVHKIDRDDEPCPGCDEPGGAHVDCDFPLAGRMTRTERLEAFGPGAP